MFFRFLEAPDHTGEHRRGLPEKPWLLSGTADPALAPSGFRATPRPSGRSTPELLHTIDERSRNWDSAGWPEGIPFRLRPSPIHRCSLYPRATRAPRPADRPTRAPWLPPLSLFGPGLSSPLHPTWPEYCRSRQPRHRPAHKLDPCL